MTKLSVLLFAVLLAVPLRAQDAKPKVLDLQVAPGKGAVCKVFDSGFGCYSIPMSDGTRVDVTESTVIIEQPGGNVLFGPITSKEFKGRGNEGTLTVHFESKETPVFSGVVSFKLYPYRYAPRVSHETAKVMLTSGELHLVFQEQEPE